MTKRWLFFLLAVLPVTHIWSQASTTQNVLEIGKPCPVFTLRGVEDYPSSTVTLNDFKGKWLFLDFWSKGCGACIQSFPRIDSLQKKFAGKIQYLLIGKKDPQGEINKIYAKFRNSLHLRIAHVFDSTLLKRFNISGNPYVIVVDPKGTVQYITTGLYQDDITDLLAGHTPLLSPVYGADEIQKNRDSILAARREIKKDSALLYRSSLYKWTPALPAAQMWQLNYSNGYFETIGNSIPSLYMLAYLGQDGVTFRDSMYGKFSNDPILEITDTNITHQTSPLKNLYCYNLMVPQNKIDKKDLMRIMQNDLKNYFGYEAKIETKLMPCWRLVVNDKSKIHLATGNETVNHRGRTDTGFVAKNIPISTLLLQISSLDLPVIDDTGIDKNIDINLNTILTDVEEIKKGLRNNGLDLVKGSKKMKVLVIRNPQPQNDVNLP